MVDFGSERGLGVFETTGITIYLEDFKKAKTKLCTKRCRFRMDTSYIESRINGGSTGLPKLTCSISVPSTSIAAA
jgi:hypothetical protein